MTKRILATAALLLIGAAPAAAQTVLLPRPEDPTTRVGTRAANFLNIGVGARARGLGEAYTALANDVSALAWNTAGITELEGFSAGLSFAQLYEGLDINHTFVGAVMPFSFAHVGVSVITLASGDIERTTINYPDPDVQADPTFGPTFEWDATAVGLHVAKRITDRMSFGLAGKVIQEGMEGARASFVAADVGLLFRTGLYGITVGASLQNVGSESNLEGSLVRDNLPNTSNNQRVVYSQRILGYEWRTQTNSLPTNFRFSLATDLVGAADALLAPNPNHRLTFITDVSDATDSDIQPAVGVEYNFNELFFLRAGKRWTNEAQIEYDFNHRAAFGAGLALPLGDRRRLVFDYAYTDYGDLDNVQVFSIEARF